jgi:hypothetical protein
MPAWDDPSQPRNVRWFCREHYDERRDAGLQLEAEHEALVDEYAALRAEIKLLPPAVQAALHEAARKGPFGRGAEPGSIWYWWTLRRELQRVQAQQIGR